MRFLFCVFATTYSSLERADAFLNHHHQSNSKYKGYLQTNPILRLRKRFNVDAPQRTGLVSENYTHRSISSVLFSKNEIGKKSNQPKGVYSRPSAAIEKGSGFYVPGFEGSKVRFVFGILALILSYLNHTSMQAVIDISSSQKISESITSVFGFLLILQALIEFGKEAGFGVNLGSDKKLVVDSIDDNSGLTDKSSASGFKETVSKEITLDEIEILRWIAASYISLTPATHFLFLQLDRLDNDSCAVVYSLGGLNTVDDDDDRKAVLSAISTVFESKGGRVSLPSTHPATVLLPEECRRCVLLQRIDPFKDDGGKRFCFLIGSNQLLPSYTKGDLNWLGQMATYFQLLQRV